MINNTTSPWLKRDLIKKLAQSHNIIETQGKSAFIEVFDTSNELQQSAGALANAIISIKDLFDVKGYQTKAGSKFLASSKPAETDAVAVAKLRAAGATLIGHTNMTELAYSGLGLNPHYGSPQTPLYAGRISGGSTSGGAVSVALDIADITLGSDTGGSLRIPAAFCGVTGFKPSQQSVSREGCLPLSGSLDCVGPIAKSVAECELAWQVLSENEQTNTIAEKAHFIIPSNFGLNDLDAEVAEAFDAFVAKLKQEKSICVEEKFLPCLEDYKTLPVWQFSAFEAKEYYQQHYQVNLDQLDPRVASRLKRADTLDATTFAATQKQRQDLIGRFQQEEGDSILLLPTVAILPPKLADLAKDEDYDRINLLCLRNTTLANVLNGCSISLPFQHQEHHIGIMLTAANNHDNQLLAAAKLVEQVITNK